MSAESKPALSVIVPVYNVEAYLGACIDSILGQTFEDFEVILVDDGSTDGCPAICDGYAERDGRVKVVHKANGGLSSARNAGMAAAHAGIYSFIDSDDLVHPQMLEALMAPLSADPSVGVAVCAYERIRGEEDCDLQVKSVPSAEIVDPVRALEVVYGNEVPNITFVAWNKVYRRSLFERSGVLYPEGKLYEDGFTTYRLLYEARKVAIVDARLYFYRVRPGSIVSGKKNVDESRMDELEADVEAWEFFRGRERSLAVASTKSLLRTCMGIWGDAGDGGFGPEAKRRAVSVYKKVWRESSKLLNNEPKKKLAYGLFAAMPYIAIRLFAGTGK